MKDKNPSITVTVRSFIFSQKQVKEFDLGKPFEMVMPLGSTVEILAKKILADKMNQLGIMAINGKATSGDRELHEGDRVDLFELIQGG
jgi:sulfur carrier protein ThiS